MTRRRIPYRTRTEFDALGVVIVLLGLILIHCLCVALL
jgi:hypothetical protein